jgi:hypothetical protein
MSRRLKSSKANSILPETSVPAIVRRRVARAIVEALEIRRLFSTVTVTTTVDTTNYPTNVTISQLNATPVSLRDAINAVNNTGGNDTISFASSLTSGGAATITLNGSELTLDDTSGTLTIAGPGANLLTISGNHASTVFQVDRGSTATIDGVTITGGLTTQQNNYGYGYGLGGGGIQDLGTLKITDSTISGNAATYQNDGYGYGGAIDAYGAALIIQGCTISSNSAAELGGGIFAINTSVTISDSTITGNSAVDGGALYAYNAPLTISDSTISGNTAQYNGAGIWEYNARNSTINNTVLIDSTRTYQTTLSGSYNILGPNAAVSGSDNISESSATAAGLGTLGYYGGTTETIPLLTGSPAINAGSNTLALDGSGNALTTDQRGTGYAREVAGAVDIGAFEVQTLSVTSNAATIAASAPTLTIAGSGFDPTAANDSVVFNDGAVGTVTSATAGTLTVTFSTAPTAGADLTAVVTADGTSSGSPVQVATVKPAVTSSTSNLSAGATSLTIAGVGFDPTIANDSVVFNDGAVGTVTAATATSLSVSLSTDPATAGSLTAVVTTNSQSSGSAVQVATVVPVVTSSTTNIPISATSVTIAGLGFDPTTANDSVVFNDGAIGHVTSASDTSLTVTFSTDPSAAGSLTAVVTTDGSSSGSAVQVATIVAGPTVTTPTQAAITDTTATLGGDVISNGGSTILARGVLVSLTSTNADPTLGGTGVTEVDDASDTTGTFTEDVTNLLENGAYTYVAFATTADGTSYSPTDAFQTNPDLIVNTISDPTSPVAGYTSLREAIAYADSLGGDQTITFDPGLTAGGAATITLGGSQLVLDDTSGTLTIDGPGANILTISGNSASRVFDVASGSTAAIDGVTITGGNASGSVDGGGILNAGTLTISDSTLTGNSAIDGIDEGQGGAIYSDGAALSIQGSTISSNQSDWIGGGILTDRTDLKISNSTITGNSALYGGAILVEYGTAEIYDSTITGNSASYDTGIYDYSSNITVNNTILLDSNSSNNSVISGSSNIVEPNSSVSGSDDIVENSATAAGLGTLGDYGGPTETIPLLAGSPAINAGSNLLAVDTSGNTLTTDQRGVSYARQIAGVVDIGAYEFQTISVTPNTTNLATSASTLTITGSGFDPSAVNDSVTFNDGAVGTVTSASASSLTVTFSTAPTVGNLTAVVTSDGTSSGSPVQVATVLIPTTVTVTDSGGVFTGSADAATALISGTGPSPVASVEGVTPTLAYYTGSTATGNSTSVAPTDVGTYTVVASFPGSTDYAASTSAPATFSITAATPDVTATDAGGIYTGTGYAATPLAAGVDANPVATLDGVTPTVVYYDGSTATGTSFSTAPIDVGTYTAVASFAGSTDYASATSAPDVFSITAATPTTTVTDAGGVYSGTAYGATAAVAGVDGTPLASIEGITPTLAYYVGSTATGTPSSTAPTDAGTYTVVASFAGSDDYAAEDSAPTTFSISAATPTVTATDAGGVFNGTSYTATPSVAGLDGTPVASLEGVTPTLDYYVGSTATGTPTSTAPTDAGTYTVVASFAGSDDYAAEDSAPTTFSITTTTPTVTVTDAGGVYNGTGYAATPLVTGIDANPVASLESVTPTLAYYAGSTVTGTPSSTAPTDVGTYTVVASFAGSDDYAAADSAPTTFSITAATPTVTVTDAGGVYNGSTYDATPLVAGADANPVASLEGVTPTLAYYSGSTATGTPLVSAPTDAGTYTVVASFAGSDDYVAADSDPTTFAIAPAPETISLSTLTQTYDGSAKSATATTTPDDISTTIVYHQNGHLVASPTEAGSYAVFAFVNDPNYSGSIHGTLVIQPANVTSAIVSLSNLTQTYNGSSKSVVVTTTPSGLTTTTTYSQNVQPVSAPTNAGTYDVSVAVNNPDYTGSATGTLTITPASLGITLGDLTQTYDGTAKLATASTTPNGVATTITYSQGGNVVATPINAGTYDVSAASADPNYSGSATGMLVVNAANPILDITGATVAYDGTSHPATGPAMGVESTPANLTPLLQLSYQNAATEEVSPAAPVYPGTYDVLARFAGNADYKAIPLFNTGKTVVISPFKALVGATIVTQRPTTRFAGKVAKGTEIPHGTVTIELAGVSKTVKIKSNGTFSTRLPTGNLPVGTYTANYTYSGSGGFRETTAQRTVTVTYRTLPKFDYTRHYPAGSSIPVALKLADSAGKPVNLSQAAVTAFGVAHAASPQTVLPLPAGTSADGLFTLDSQTGEYDLNLSTAGLAAGKYFLLFSITGDPTVHSVPFIIA